MSAITPAIRPAIGPAIRSAFDGGFAPSLLSQAMRITRTYGGALYAPSVLSSLYQDAAGTLPVTAPGQPVGLMLDLSGNGNHASQITTTARPLYQIIDGYPCIVGDGVDDQLFANSLSSFLDNTNSWYFSLAAKVTGATDYPLMLHQTRSTSPVTRVTCMQGKVSGLAGLERYVAGTANGDSGYAQLLPLLNTSRVASYGFSQSLCRARWNNTTGISKSGSFASVGTTAAPVSLFLLGGNVYGSAFVAATPTPAEQLILTRFLASRSGVTL